MLSSRGIKTIRLQRKRSGLDFSVKGGKEHGIPIVISWIKPGGVAGRGPRELDIRYRGGAGSS